MAEDDLLVVREGGVLRLTLNRPQFRNALSQDMGPRLARTMQEAQDDPNTRCVLVTATGAHFSAGGDMAGFQRSATMPTAERRADFHSRMTRVAELASAFAAFDRPLIVRCRGAIAGAGLMFPLVGDIVLADDTVSFLFAHIRMGLSPDCGVTWFLPRVVGARQARRLLLTAATIKAQEALSLGLVTEIHDADALDAAADAMAERLSRAPQTAIRATKRLVSGADTSSLAAHLMAEREAFVSCVGERDFEEAVRAFAEKRSPVFSSAEPP